MSECLCCKDERVAKGVPPMEKIVLPASVTASATFRKHNVPVYLCSNCDGENLVTSALRLHQQRQGK